MLLHVPQQKRNFIDLILDESDQAWRMAGAPPMLLAFAANIRRLFLLVGGVNYLPEAGALENPQGPVPVKKDRLGNSRKSTT